MVLPEIPKNCSPFLPAPGTSSVKQDTTITPSGERAEDWTQSYSHIAQHMESIQIKVISTVFLPFGRLQISPKLLK